MANHVIGRLVPATMYISHFASSKCEMYTHAEVPVSCCNSRGRHFISSQYKNNHENRHYNTFTCIYIVSSQLNCFQLSRSLPDFIALNKPSSLLVTSACMSISCFEKAKREMDTVDWHVYFTFSHDTGLQRQLESVDTNTPVQVVVGCIDFRCS